MNERLSLPVEFKRWSSPEVIAKIEQTLTYFKVNWFYTPDDYYKEDIIKKERADFCRVDAHDAPRTVDFR